MDKIITYRLSEKKDLDDIRALLNMAGLPASDLDEGKIDFVVAANESAELVGCIGLERLGVHGLLRSMAVDENYRNNRIGHELFYRLLSLSKQLGVNDLHLLTTTAEKFFLAAGFKVLPRDTAPESIRSTSEFSTICPSSSIYMVLRNINELESGFWKDTQIFQKDKETGSAYWAIKGQNLLFTYFEVAPETAFEMHSHESEQITYVLEGELFFEIENKTYRLINGDTILIPVNKKHKAWTSSKHTKAVDAWSPINEKYINA